MKAVGEGILFRDNFKHFYFPFFGAVPLGTAYRILVPQPGIDPDPQR